jgi:DNA-binding NarL/FixJ family response regulator
MIRVLIADDFPVVRRGLAEILREEPDIELGAEAGDAAGVMAALAEGEWQVAILDLSMPGAHGLDLVRRVRAERPEVALLLLSMHPEEQYAVQSLKAGAAGYLGKQSAAEEMVRAVRIVAAGGRYFSPALTERLLGSAGLGAVQPHETISEREFQVLRLIGAGYTTGEIAERLVLSVKTVSTYRARLLEKMGMRTNAELMRYVHERDLVDE